MDAEELVADRDTSEQVIGPFVLPDYIELRRYGDRLFLRSERFGCEREIYCARIRDIGSAEFFERAIRPACEDLLRHIGVGRYAETLRASQ